jgi:hypothetical protein
MWSKNGSPATPGYAGWIPQSNYPKLVNNNPNLRKEHNTLTIIFFPLKDNKIQDLPTSLPAPRGIISRVSPVSVGISNFLFAILLVWVKTENRCDVIICAFATKKKIAMKDRRRLNTGSREDKMLARRHNPLAVQLEEDSRIKPISRAKGVKRETKRERSDDGFVSQELSKKILKQAREQREEEEEEFVKFESLILVIFHTTSSHRKQKC